MFKERTPTWIITGGFLLAAIAGAVNVVGLMGFVRQPICHLTGVITQLGLDLGQWDPILAGRMCLVVLAFFLGSAVSAVIIRDTAVRVGRRYGVVLTCESLLLFIAYLLLRRSLFSGHLVAAAACGLQNAMATSYSGSILRTTHLTGMVTDLGIFLGQRLLGRPIDWHRTRFYLAILLGFTTGAMLGSISYSMFGYASILGPSFCCGVAGCGYAMYRHRLRLRGEKVTHAM
ncbi:MAG: YoaK family protein [Opitutaceae bacterium]|nr:YoaK family protein [Opitutaceae bacterium]